MSATKKTRAQVMADAGIHIEFCKNACFPQIPMVQDVLHCIHHFIKRKHFGDPNFIGYTADVILVAGAVANDIVYDCWEDPPEDNIGPSIFLEDKALAIIAQAIVDLCSEEARCLWHSAYVDCLRILGKPVPAVGTSRQELFALCTCTYCKNEKLISNMNM